MGECRVCAPVAVFVYKRKDYAERTLRALRKNFLALQTDLYIFSDGAKNEKDLPQVEQVQDFVRSFAADAGFRSIHVNLSSYNNGLAFSIITGATQLMEKYGKVIVLEDDLLVSRDFLMYMNDALDYYEKDSRIWSVSGYAPALKGLKGREGDVFFFYRASSWGWATWKNRWEQVDWSVSDYPQLMKSPDRLWKLVRGGTDMPGMLRQQMEGEIDSWAIRWCYTQSMLDMLTVYPAVSRVRNLGNDGSGTHTAGVASEFDTVLNENYKPCVFQEPEINWRLVKEFRLLYDIGLKGKLNRCWQRTKVRGRNQLARSVKRVIGSRELKRSLRKRERKDWL